MKRINIPCGKILGIFLMLREAAYILNTGFHGVKPDFYLAGVTYKLLRSHEHLLLSRI
jgi:hypothetical protein